MSFINVHSVIIINKNEDHFIRWFIRLFNNQYIKLYITTCYSLDQLLDTFEKHQIRRVYWHINHFDFQENIFKKLTANHKIDFVLLTNCKEIYFIKDWCKRVKPQAIWHEADMFQSDFFELLLQTHVNSFLVSKTLQPLFQFPQIDLDKLDFEILKGIQSGKFNKENIDRLPCSESTYYEHLKKMKIHFGIENKNDVKLIATAIKHGYLSTSINLE